MASGRRRRLVAAFVGVGRVDGTRSERRGHTRLDAVGGEEREPRRRRCRETTRTPHKQTKTLKNTGARWKAWWAGQGHPTCVNNTNLERYIPDCPVDVSYDAEVSQELHGPDNLPRLEEEDDEDEDDLLLEEILEGSSGTRCCRSSRTKDWARCRC